MKVVAFLPAKGSSLRIENKNRMLLDGQPLFLRTLEKLADCDFIDEVYLDTESDEFMELASEVNCKVLRRDPALASNSTDGHQLFMNEVRQVEADIYIQVLCTSPFIDPSTILEGVRALADSEEHDSAVLVRNEVQYTWSGGSPDYDIEHIPNSVDLEPATIETMGLYIVRGEAALKYNRRLGANPYLIQATPLEAIDVNWPEDFELANLIASGLREKDRRLLSSIKNRLSSSMLSDILDDLGYPNQVIGGLHPNYIEASLLGRAATLSLRKLADGEDFSGIYDALDSYERIRPGDVILVENEVPEYAYFGELNANLAIRAGASGVIVDGMTRDTAAVVNTRLPVFARGHACQDVRKRATMRSINKTISIEGVEINPGCLVYGDAEGIVIIPRAVEERVLSEVYARAQTEKNILTDIAMGVAVKDLVRDHGFF